MAINRQTASRSTITPEGLGVRGGRERINGGGGDDPPPIWQLVADVAVLKEAVSTIKGRLDIIEHDLKDINKTIYKASGAVILLLVLIEKLWPLVVAALSSHTPTP